MPHGRDYLYLAAGVFLLWLLLWLGLDSDVQQDVISLWTELTTNW